MRNNQKIINSNKLLKAGIVLIAFLIAVTFGGFSNPVNSAFTNFIRFTTGPGKVDSNIVIIHITNGDIQQLNGWPIKRSYYALLLNQLAGLGVKRVGFEIFLSENLATQNIYNDLIVNESKKIKRVVFGSIAEIVDDKNLHAENIRFPVTAELSGDVITGHLNFIQNDNLLIPSKLSINDSMETAFSLNLVIDSVKNFNRLIQPNFFNTWTAYENYSLLNILSKFTKDEFIKNQWRDKVVLIGVSENTLAKSVKTFYDEELPGIGMHAFTVDNILNHSELVYGFIFIPLLFLLLLVSSILFFDKASKQFLNLAIFTVSTFITGLIMFINHYVFNYSAVLIPLFAAFVYESVMFLINRNKELEQFEDESKALNKLLKMRELELENLQNELGNSKSAEMIEQVDSLKEEIKLLKISNKDEVPVERSPGDAQIFEGIVFKSNAMYELVESIKKVAPTDAACLILGDSGSGKELVARALHNLSGRKDNNFVAINCAALSESLLESELFGHVKGAFTNAVTDKKGLFEEADKGTIFLDEIGETSENFQVKLLRILQSGEYQKVGSTRLDKADVRIIAATNKDLLKLVDEKKFRRDLFYRLNVIMLGLPSLKERKDDIEVLADYFLKIENAELKLSRAVIDSLNEYNFPGNVRELQSIIKRAAIFVGAEQRDLIQLSDLPKEIAKLNKTGLDVLILESLRNKSFSHSSINETAKELGDISRTIVSENFRGIILRELCNSEFNIEAAAKAVTNSNDQEQNDRVKSKAEIYLKNLQKDLAKLETKDFDLMKDKFASKFKNLPRRYHKYLEDTIKWLIEH